MERCGCGVLEMCARSWIWLEQWLNTGYIQSPHKRISVFTVRSAGRLFSGCGNGGHRMNRHIFFGPYGYFLQCTAACCSFAAKATKIPGLSFRVKAVLILAVGLVHASTAASDTLNCSRVSEFIPDVDLNYAEDEAGLRYGLAWDSGGNHWLGTAFEFHEPFGANPLLAGITRHNESTVTSVVVTNFRGLLLDMGIHPELGPPVVYETMSGEVITFKAVDDAFPSAYGFHVKPVEGGVQVFRVSGVPQDDNPASPSDRATVDAVVQLKRSCISDAA